MHESDDMKQSIENQKGELTLTFYQYLRAAELTLLLLLLAIIGISCVVTPNPVVEENSGDALSMPTIFISSTLTLTATETPLPSVTPTPTRTPRPTLTNTITPSSTASPTTYFECPGTLPSKLNISNQARVNYFQVSARSAPGFSSPKEHVLAQGRLVEIVSGPQCTDQAVWWQIHFVGTISSGEYLDYQAWMPEVDNDTYYLIHAP